MLKKTLFIYLIACLLLVGIALADRYQLERYEMEPELAAYVFNFTSLPPINNDLSITRSYQPFSTILSTNRFHVPNHSESQNFFKNTLIFTDQQASSSPVKVALSFLVGINHESIAGNSLRLNLPSFQLDTNTNAIECVLTGPDSVKALVGSAVSTPQGFAVTCPLDAGINFASGSLWTLSISGLITPATGPGYLYSPSCQATSEDDVISTLYGDDAALPYSVPDTYSFGQGSLCCAGISIDMMYSPRAIWYSASSAEYCTFQPTLPLSNEEYMVGNPGASNGFYALKLSAPAAYASDPVTLTASFWTTKGLESLAKTAEETGAQDIPNYLWLRLPGYRVVHAEDDFLNNDVVCDIYLGDDMETSHSHAGTSLSPKTRVRPLISENQAGLIVQCAVGSEIAPNTHITLKVSNIIAPDVNSLPPSCYRFSPYSYSSECCNNINVSYAHGNSVQNTAVYRSKIADQCPIFPSANANENVSSNAAFENLGMSPVQVTVGTTIPFTKLEWVAGIDFDEGAMATITLPGFKHVPVEGAEDADAVMVNIMVTGPDGESDSYAVAVSAAYEANNTKLVLAWEWRTLAVSGSSISIIIAGLVPTQDLPSHEQCTVFGVGGTATTDGLCCSSFTVKLVVNNQTPFVAYPSQCPSLPVDTTTPCDDNQWSYGRCCTAARRAQSADINQKCLDQECTDDSIPFKEDVCCQHPQYRINTRCCSRAFFCPNECCGQLQFNSDKCCVPEHIEELGIQQTCNCYDTLDLFGTSPVESASTENNDDQSVSWYEQFDDMSCCADEWVVDTTYCQCKDLFASRSDDIPEYVELTEDNEDNTVTEVDGEEDPQYDNSTLLYFDLARPECCAFELPLYQQDPFCLCYLSMNTVGSIFNKKVCCAYAYFAPHILCKPDETPIVDPEPCTPPTPVEPEKPCNCGCDDGCECAGNRQNVKINGVNSGTGPTVIDINNGDCDGDDCGCNGSTPCGAPKPCDSSTTTPEDSGSE